MVDEREEERDSTAAIVILYVDYFTAVYFTIEYAVRIGTTPRKFHFFVQPMNLVDLFAILPYFINMILDHLSEFHIIGKAGKVIETFFVVVLAWPTKSVLWCTTFSSR